MNTSLVLKATRGGFLSTHEITTAFPTVGQTERFSGVSARYTPVSTLDVIGRYAEQGWLPVEAKVQRTRGLSRVGFQKHALRFRRHDAQPVLGEFLPEINLVNAHDGTGAFVQDAALVVLACYNGLISSSEQLARVSIPHIGSLDRFTAASQHVLTGIPILTERVVAFQERQLTQAERLEFAKAALLLRYDDFASAPIEASRLLSFRRISQSSNSLWHTFNTVQENLVKGGQRSYKRSESGRRVGSSRAVSSVDIDLAVNRGLWDLAERSLRGLPLVDLSKVDLSKVEITIS